MTEHVILVIKQQFAEAHKVFFFLSLINMSYKWIQIGADVDLECSESDFAVIY